MKSGKFSKRTEGRRQEAGGGQRGGVAGNSQTLGPNNKTFHQKSGTKAKKKIKIKGKSRKENGRNQNRERNSRK